VLHIAINDENHSVLTKRFVQMSVTYIFRELCKNLLRGMLGHLELLYYVLSLHVMCIK